jgi:hypothetical protein
VSEAGVSTWLDLQSSELVESDHFGRYVRRYAVNGAALVLEGVGHWLTDKRPDELAAASLGAFSEVGEANAGQVPSKNVIVQPHGPASGFCFPMSATDPAPCALGNESDFAGPRPRFAVWMRTTSLVSAAFSSPPDSCWGSPIDPLIPDSAERKPAKPCPLGYYRSHLVFPALL